MRDFPIDVVYTWADLSEKVYKDALSACGISHFSKSRASDHGELRESIKSLKRFAPWVNRVFIVTMDGQIPNIEYPSNLTLVHHSEIFGDNKADLPVFNSHAIGCHLHRIPGLSDNFIYFNDDCFVGDYLQPADFYFDADTPKFFLGKSRRQRLSSNPLNRPYLYARQNNLILLREIFGSTLRNLDEPRHQAIPLRRQFFEKMLDNPNISSRFRQTSSSKLRSPEDIAPVILCSQWGLLSEHFKIGEIRSIYSSLTDIGPLESKFKRLQRLRPQLYCLNDCFHFRFDARVNLAKDLIRTSLPHHTKDAYAWRFRSLYWRIKFNLYRILNRMR